MTRFWSKVQKSDGCWLWTGARFTTGLLAHRAPWRALSSPCYSPNMAATAHDVAAYILKRMGTVTTWKLQKLVYYSQAWSLVWDEAPLFKERIEAWANGPVVPALYDYHRGQFGVAGWRWGDASSLSAKQKATIDGVIKFYGHKSSQWLSELTHREAPWKNARAGVPAGERSNRLITHGAMADYYGSLK